MGKLCPLLGTFYKAKQSIHHQNCLIINLGLFYSRKPMTNYEHSGPQKAAPILTDLGLCTHQSRRHFAPEISINFVQSVHCPREVQSTKLNPLL